MHCAVIPSHHVHVLYIPGTGCLDAHHVVHWQLESDNVWSVVVRRFMDSYWQLRTMEVADVLVSFCGRSSPMNALTLTIYSDLWRTDHHFWSICLLYAS